MKRFSLRFINYENRNRCHIYRDSDQEGRHYEQSSNSRREFSFCQGQASFSEGR